jgi:divalent metal cation (Fe/Co/Zn/Cd) transporter
VLFQLVSPVHSEVIEPSRTLRERALRIEYFTIFWCALEALVGLLAGVLAGSIALVGFGLDSVLEVVAGAALVWRFRQPGEREDEAESRALRIVGVTFFVLAAYVSYESLGDLWLRRQPKESLAGIVLAAVSLVVMPLLGRAKHGVSRHLGSRALQADAMETYLCALLSLTLLVGLGLNAALGWWWADPAAALVMVVFMIHEGLEALRPDV